MSKISVIIPLYNREMLIGATLLSILNQTISADEIILVDDGSTDQSVETAQSTFEGWKKDRKSSVKLPKFKILKQENKGAGAARNRGLSEARGEFIHFFDSDDIASENKHEVQLRAMEERGADIVYSPWVKFSQNNYGVKVESFVLQQSLPKDNNPLHYLWLRGWSTVLQSMLFRRAFLNRIGLFREDMPSHQDSEYMTRILFEKPRVAFASEGLVLYRIHQFGNITALDSRPRLSRAVDRAKYLFLADEEIWKRGEKIDWYTQVWHDLAFYKCYLDFKSNYQHKHPTGQLLKARLGFIKKCYLPAIAILDRISTYLRFHTIGTRYSSGICPAKATPSQCKRINLLADRYIKSKKTIKENQSISVIIPVYNRAHLIGETLLSLLNQTVSANEIIIVDDGSTEDIAIVVHTVFAEWKSKTLLGQKFPELTVIRQDNRGPAAARNTGFAKSKGNFIHFFDSDDLAAPNMHETQLEALNSSNADIAYAPWVKGQINDGCFTPENNVLQQLGLPKKNLVKALMTNWSIVAHACMFRRSILNKVGGFDESLIGTEDQMMFLRCLMAEASVTSSPGTLELYRIADGAGNLTSSGPAQKKLIINWARFLVISFEICQSKFIFLNDWFCFRRRVWEAIEDLQMFGVVDPDLISSLTEILRGHDTQILYKIHRLMERMYLGLKFRIRGERTLANFRPGPISRKQHLFILEMGLEIKYSSFWSRMTCPKW